MMTAQGCACTRCGTIVLAWMWYEREGVVCISCDSVAKKPERAPNLVGPQHVCGFVFNDGGLLVLLKHIGSQRTNIGGPILAGERPVDAMIREFEAATGVRTTPSVWTGFATHHGPWGTAWWFHADMAISVAAELYNVGYWAVQVLPSYRSTYGQRLSWLAAMARSGDVCRVASYEGDGL